MINVGLINYTRFIAAAPGAAWSMAMRGQFIMLISPISMLLSVINNSLVPVCKQSLACSMGTHCTAGNEWIIGGWLLMLDA